MVRGIGDRFGGLGAKVTESPGLSITPEGSVETLVNRLDIGASAFVAGPRHAFDIDVAALPGLLEATASQATARSQLAFVQIPGRCLPLSEALVDERLADIDGRPRLRILITDTTGRQAENIALELWKQSSRAYRSLSDHNGIRLSIPGAAPPAHGPARTDQLVEWPIDVVYTWVDGADPEWRAMAAEHLELPTLDADLYTQTDELRYSLRSVETFAPWVNHVYVLSNCAPPSWFAPNKRITWVDHRKVAAPQLLPLFSSTAIETLLHHVPGLTEHFLYLNDDFMLWDSVTPAMFFTWDDRSIARMAMNSSVIYLQQLVESGGAQPSQHSRVNAARLLQDRLGIFSTRIHGHVPYALRRSMMEQIERDFAAEFTATRASRTRSDRDISFVPYVYPHYAYAQGKAVYAEAPRSFVTLQNYQRASMHRALRQAPFVCFQDSRGSATDRDYQAYKRETLENALPLPSSAELVVT